MVLPQNPLVNHHILHFMNFISPYSQTQMWPEHHILPTNSTHDGGYAASIFRFLPSQCLFHLRFVTKGGVGYGVDETQKAAVLSASSGSCWNGLLISSELVKPLVPIDIDSD